MRDAATEALIRGGVGLGLMLFGAALVVSAPVVLVRGVVSDHYRLWASKRTTEVVS